MEEKFSDFLKRIREEFIWKEIVKKINEDDFIYRPKIKEHRKIRIYLNIFTIP